MREIKFISIIGLVLSFLMIIALLVVNSNTEKRIVAYEVIGKYSGTTKYDIQYELALFNMETEEYEEKIVTASTYSTSEVGKIVYFKNFNTIYSKISIFMIIPIALLLMLYICCDLVLSAYEEDTIVKSIYD